MPSFATVTALATLVFATLGSALPHAAVNGGTGLQGVNSGVNVYGRTTGLPTDGLLAALTHATGKRDVNPDLFAIISAIVGVKVEDLIEICKTKLSVLDGSNIDIANAKAIQSRGGPQYPHLSGDDIKVISIIAAALGIKVEDLLTLAETKIAVLPNANIDVLNAVAHQSRDGLLPDLKAVEGVTKGGLAPTKLSRGEPRSFPTVLVSVIAKVEDIAAKIRATVAVDVGAVVDVHAVVSLLQELQVVIVDACAEVKVLVDAHIDGVLVLDGKVLSVEAVAGIVASLITSIVVALGIAVKAVVSVKADVDVVLSLVAQISVALAAIVNISVQLCAGILVYLAPRLDVVVKLIVDLKLTALIEACGIHA